LAVAAVPVGSLAGTAFADGKVVAHHKGTLRKLLEQEPTALKLFGLACAASW